LYYDNDNTSEKVLATCIFLVAEAIYLW